MTAYASQEDIRRLLCLAIFENTTEEAQLLYAASAVRVGIGAHSKIPLPQEYVKLRALAEPTQKESMLLANSQNPDVPQWLVNRLIMCYPQELANLENSPHLSPEAKERLRQNMRMSLPRELRPPRHGPPWTFKEYVGNMHRFEKLYSQDIIELLTIFPSTENVDYFLMELLPKCTNPAYIARDFVGSYFKIRSGVFRPSAYSTPSYLLDLASVHPAAVIEKLEDVKYVLDSLDRSLQLLSPTRSIGRPLDAAITKLLIQYTDATTIASPAPASSLPPNIVFTPSAMSLLIEAGRAPALMYHPITDDLVPALLHGLSSPQAAEFHQSRARLAALVDQRTAYEEFTTQYAAYRRYLTPLGPPATEVPYEQRDIAVAVLANEVPTLEKAQAEHLLSLLEDPCDALLPRLMEVAPELVPPYLYGVLRLPNGRAILPSKADAERLVRTGITLPQDDGYTMDEHLPTEFLTSSSAHLPGAAALLLTQKPDEPTPMPACKKPVAPPQ
jgi:hypothetical protein